MQTWLHKHTLMTILFIYTACYACRIVEYMLLRTDRTFWGEAFLHKLTGLLLLYMAIRFLSYKWSGIGFSPVLKRPLVSGLLLGLSVFTLAYGAEYYIEYASGNSPVLRMYVTSYGISGNYGNHTAPVYYLICLAGNVINVLMEEGVFRGLFIKLTETKYSFSKAAAFSSILFGLWHLAAPARSVLDGEMTAIEALLPALALASLSAVFGIMLCLSARITGSLWMPMAVHFVNNTIVNLLHVVTAAGADSLQGLRITIAQSAAFMIVLCLCYRSFLRRRRPI